MDQELELVRKAAFRRAALEDGVIDILCGLCLIGWGLLVEAGQAAMGGVLFATVYPSGLALRKRLIEPRIGHVALPGTEVRAKKLLLIGLFTLTAVLGVVAFLLATPELSPDGSGGSAFADRMAALGILVLALPLTLAATAMGAIFGAARAHFYAVWIFTAFLVVHLTAPTDSAWAEPSLPLAISGLAPLLMGLGLFTRFLRSHPVVEAPAEFYDASH